MKVRKFVALLLIGVLGLGISALTEVARAEEKSSFLVVPPPDSELLAKLSFIETSQARVPGGVLAAPVRQAAITMHLDTAESASFAEETEVPPGLFDDLVESPGWKKTVQTTHDW